MATNSDNMQRLISGYMKWEKRQQEIEKRLGIESPTVLQAFSLRGSTASQQEALRTLAYQSGFTNMQGFANWIKEAGLNFYDLIKVASPE